MPKTSDYSKGFIYKIVCNDITIPNTYTGSSVDWVKRKANHKSCCNNTESLAHNKYLYKFIRENGNWENWKMVKVCDYACETKFQLESEERKYMELFKSDLNKNIPTRTQKEYRLNNKDHLDLMTKMYCEENKEEINAKRKLYRETNAELLNEKQKTYYLNNIKKIKEREQKPYICACCNKSLSTQHKSRHEKSKHFLKFILLKGDQPAHELVV